MLERTLSTGANQPVMTALELGLPENVRANICNPCEVCSNVTV